MPYMQHVDKLLFLKNTIDHAIDTMRLATVQEMPQAPCFVRYWPEIGMSFEVQDGLFQARVPAARRIGVACVNLIIEGC